MLGGLFVVACVAKHFAVFERRFAPEAIGYIVVKMKLHAEQHAAVSALAFLVSALEGFALYLFGEFTTAHAVPCAPSR